MIRFITRWALTSGIRRVDGSYESDGKYFTNHGRGHIFVLASEAFETVEDAQAEARRMADKKIASLKKQLATLSDPNWKAKVTS